MRRLAYLAVFLWAAWAVARPLLLECELRRIEEYNRAGLTYTEGDRLDFSRPPGRE